MLKRSLPLYFLVLSLLTSILVLFAGIFVTWLEQDILSKRLYQTKQWLSSDIYFHMMDYTIPGNNIRSQEIQVLPLMLATLFGVNITDPAAILANEIPLKRIQPKEPQNNINDESSEALVAINQQVQAQSLLSDQAPVLAYWERPNPTVFVYHTHSRESWYSEVSKTNNKAVPFHPTHNITLVGKVFADRLEDIGIPIVYNDTDHDQLLLDKNKTRAYAYAVSANTVVEAMNRNPEIEYIFDFHRDAVARKYTTATINGVDYAKIMFVIGKGNKNWQQNYAFAEKLQAILDEKYPGLCRAIASYEQNNAHNGEYNQSFSSKALTVEIGGIENTLEESLRTVNILADAFAEVYFDVIPVIAQKMEDPK